MPSAFLDRAAPPSARELAAVLGETAEAWIRLRDHLAAAFPPLTEKWSFSGRSHGWLLRLTRRKRTIVYLVPGPGFFVASFALKAKVCEAVATSQLPSSVREAVARAPVYAEGRGLRLEVRRERDLSPVEALAAVAMAVD